MRIVRRMVKVYVYKIILCIMLLAAVVFGYEYFSVTGSPKTTGLLGGLTVGLCIALIQLLIALYEHNEIEAIRKLGIIDILPHRDNERLYKGIISAARKEVLVLGSTAFRFLDDFANDEREDKRTLLDVLERHQIKVRFLLPNREFLVNDDDRHKFDMAAKRLENLARNHGSVTHQYYQHAPFHNLVLADNKCLVGPIFPNTPSKDCPAIYIDKDSVFVEPYLKYFEYEWKKAQPKSNAS